MFNHRGFCIKRTVLSLLTAAIIAASASSALIVPKIDSYAASAAQSASKKIALNKKKITLTAGDCFGLKLKNATGKVTWKSSKKSVATVSKKGRIEALRAGKATITATYKGKKYKCTVTVKMPTLLPIDDLVVCKKPVMYFYPEADNTGIKASVDFAGRFTTVYPAFTDEAGHSWEFEADRDGTIRIGEREYGYLFWEGVPDTGLSIDTGYCVAQKDLVPFLEEKLTELGLNSRERNDFITYWLPELGRYSYDIISFDATAYTRCAKLNIKPAPDTLIRVFMTYRGSDKAVRVKAPAVTKTPDRTGFTVVEWGGSEIRD